MTSPQLPVLEFRQVQKQIQKLSQVQIKALNYLAMGNENLRDEIYRAVGDNPALEIVKAGGIDITVTDLRMAPMDGMALFREIRKVTSVMPVIMLTGCASIETAIDAMKSGIFD